MFKINLLEKIADKMSIIFSDKKDSPTTKNKIKDFIAGTIQQAHKNFLEEKK